MALLGIGTDIIEVSRIQKAIERQGERFLKRLYTPQELEYCLQFKEPKERLAARFAAKEAIAKALGKGIGKGLDWLDIEIGHDLQGRPLALLSEAAKALFSPPTAPIQIHLTISHCKEYATATAIVELSEASHHSRL
ncbi:MAG: acpS [Chlamydiales bacterium]|nr:acpS [Chlamydiales bacterium]